MSSRLFANNLYNYLLKLSEILENRGAAQLAQNVVFASRFASGSTTELYAESYTVLQNVLRNAIGILTEDENVELKEKIAGINLEFERIGGA